MSNIDRFGICNDEKVIFTKAPFKTKKQLEEADMDVERMKKMMGINMIEHEKKMKTLKECDYGL